MLLRTLQNSAKKSSRNQGRGRTLCGAQINAHDEATRQEFVVLDELKKIEVVHAAFDKHVIELAEMASNDASLDAP